MRGPVSSRASSSLASLADAADLVVRGLFFALAPFAIVRAAAFFPVTGTLVGAAAALLVAIGSEAAATFAARSRLARLVFARGIALDAFYRERPPRPFLYYVFYPLLAPYWLLARDARREFLLFKGYTLGGVALLLATSAVEFYRSWQPELTARDYLPVFGVTLAVDAVLALSLVMPIATTVIGLHRSGRLTRLFVLLMVAPHARLSVQGGVLRKGPCKSGKGSFASDARGGPRRNEAAAASCATLCHENASKGINVLFHWAVKHPC